MLRGMAAMTGFRRFDRYGAAFIEVFGCGCVDMGCVSVSEPPEDIVLAESKGAGLVRGCSGES